MTGEEILGIIAILSVFSNEIKMAEEQPELKPLNDEQRLGLDFLVDNCQAVADIGLHPSNTHILELDKQLALYTKKGYNVDKYINFMQNYIRMDTEFDDLQYGGRCCR